MDLRPRSIGELLDRSVTMMVHNVLPLGAIAAGTVVANYLVNEALFRYVTPHLFPRAFWFHPNAFAIGFATRTFIVTIVDDIVATVGVMASAVVIEDVLSGVRPDLRDALEEAFAAFGRAMLVLVLFVIPLAVSSAIFGAGMIAVVSSNRIVNVLGFVALLCSFLCDILIQAALFAAWVHVALRKTDLGGWQLEGGLFALRPNITTALAVVTIFGLTNLAAAVNWVSVNKLSMPTAVSDVTFYAMWLVSMALLYSFVTFFYLDLCARYAGVDLEADVGDAIRSSKVRPT